MTRTPIVVNRATTLITNDCLTCGVVFAMPERLLEQRRENHAWFYCPNGHAQHFAQSGTERQLEAERKENARLKSLVLSERATVERLSSDLMDKAKELKRVKKRAEIGVCQKCNRSFLNVTRHMETQHGDS